MSAFNDGYRMSRSIVDPKSSLHPSRQAIPRQSSSARHLAQLVPSPPSSRQNDRNTDASASSSTSTTAARFPVLQRDLASNQLLVAAPDDGERDLKEELRGHATFIEAENEIIRALSATLHGRCKIDGLVVLVRRCSGVGNHATDFEAGIVALYTDPTLASSQPRLPLAAGEIKLSGRYAPLYLVDSALVNAASHKPPGRPGDMPRLIWQYNDQSTIGLTELTPEQIRFRRVAERNESHVAYERLPPDFSPPSGQAALSDALKSVLRLIKEYIGVAGTTPVARAQQEVHCEREVFLLRQQVKDALHSREEIEICDPWPGIRPLHFFGRLCWTWTGEAYAIFEVVASGESLIQLQVWRTTSVHAIDFGQLCGLPIYTNTRPQDRGLHEHDDVHFRILGTVQGGNTHVVFVTPFDFLHRTLQTTLKVEYGGIGFLTPILPPITPDRDPGLTLRARKSMNRLAVMGAGMARSISRSRSPSGRSGD